MSIADSKIFIKQLRKDKTIPDNIQRLRIISLGSVYTYQAELTKYIGDDLDEDLKWLLLKKAFFSLDSSIIFLEKFEKKRLFKKVLKNSWGVKKKKQLIEQVNYLIDGSNSYYANTQIALYLELEYMDLDINPTNIKKTKIFKDHLHNLDDSGIDHLIGALNIIDNNKHLITKNWVRGFDLARIVHVVRMGYCTKKLSLEEVWEILDSLLDELNDFESYYDYFASTELGFRLFDYDRDLDMEENIKNRQAMLGFILLGDNSPFKYISISDDIKEDPEDIFKRILLINDEEDS